MDDVVIVPSGLTEHNLMSPIGASEGASDIFDLTIGPYLDYSSKLGIIVDFDGKFSPHPRPHMGPILQIFIQINRLLFEKGGLK